MASFNYSRQNMIEPHSVFDEVGLFELAIDITKEYCKGGGPDRPSVILESTFKSLVEINNSIRGKQQTNQ